MDFQGKTLAVIGASYLQRPLVEKALSLGLRVIGFAWEKGAVCRDLFDQFFPISIVEKEQIAQVCREQQIHGVTTIASDVAVPTMNHVAMTLGLMGNSEKSAFLSTNKYAMREALRDAGVRCPSFWRICSMAELDSIKVKAPFPLIVKPCDRSGSMGVTRVNTMAQLHAAVEIALNDSLCGEAIVEEFIENAKEISVEGISWQGVYYVLAFTDKVTTGSPHYVELGHHQPADLPEASQKEAIRQAKLGVQALQIEYGASHPELMITPDGRVYVTEIGARMGGDFIGTDLVPLSTGYDFLRGIIEVSLGEFTPPKRTLNRCSGVWFYTSKTPEVREYLDHPEQFSAMVRCELQNESLPELTCSADRSGYFIYQSDSRLTCRVEL